MDVCSRCLRGAVTEVRSGLSEPLAAGGCTCTRCSWLEEGDTAVAEAQSNEFQGAGALMVALTSWRGQREEERVKPCAGGSVKHRLAGGNTAAGLAPFGSLPPEGIGERWNGLAGATRPLPDRSRSYTGVPGNGAELWRDRGNGRSRRGDSLVVRPADRSPRVRNPRQGLRFLPRRIVVPWRVPPPPP
ncbi:hypothetical protein SKAU_G00173790 [Synaphobranchus kaupii]|uniref:Uncharacterized protein n=1 Tax=Synaphobranchus kaupii TaxID=118154 RepID=A0A9Q1IYU8_SYNKA|nr:hypothetical protein SKAU_G00173790 [Synaphobranchus kaupii]